jgi:trimethylamine--corrinoid protein Co-methyltransferase
VEDIGLKSSLYRPLTEKDIKSIEDAAYRVLEQSGMLVFSATAREAFKQAGADVDESRQLVKLSRSFVEDAIASNPSSITLY